LSVLPGWIAEQSDVSDDLMTVTVRRHARRLSDKILIAFHQACDQADFEVAERLLNILETMTAALRLSRARHAAASGAARRPWFQHTSGFGSFAIPTRRTRHRAFGRSEPVRDDEQLVVVRDD
jgi:hypothetical protein